MIEKATSEASIGVDLAEDLFVLGRRACAARATELGERATFVRSRQLMPSGAWRGPRDAAVSYVEEEHLPALGGLEEARRAGARTIVGGLSPALHQAAAAGGMRSIWRLPFSARDDEAERLARIRSFRSEGAASWGVLPTPVDEPHGLDTLRLFARCRIELRGTTHLVADIGCLGPRLAQMCLGFGADELFGPIVAERALRLGDNARNPAMTRREAAALIRGAGLAAAERLSGDVLEEVPA